MGPMKVITVRQPWAWAIIHGGKDVENRSRNIVGSYRGPVAIHAALAVTDDYDLAKRTCDELVPVSEWDRPLHRGAIIGTVDVVDVHEWIDDSVCYGHVGPDDEATCSPWAMPDHKHIILANPVAFDKPIPATGRLGLWNWEPTT